MRCLRELWVLILIPTFARAQEPAARPPAFEVASVKPGQHVKTPDGYSYSSIDNPTPGNLVAINASLAECIRWAYNVKEYQLSGPDWLNSSDTTFDIKAKAPAGTPRPEIRRMLQTLLAERLKLELHRETRMLPVYYLVAVKGGPKLQQPKTDGRHGFASAGGHLEATNVTMADFADEMARDTDRPVFDKTGISGRFDLKLDYSPDRSDNPDRPSLFTALQEQLGLRLESQKGPVEVLVIDRADRVPSAN